MCGGGGGGGAFTTFSQLISVFSSFKNIGVIESLFLGAGAKGGGAQTFIWGGQEASIAMKGAQSKVKWGRQ